MQFVRFSEQPRRVKVKMMLSEWEQEDPGRIDRLFRSITNVRPSHLADPTLFDFASLEEQRSLVGGPLGPIAV